MNLKNVEYANSKDYMDDLVKSLSNFCSKSPLKPTLKVVREMGLIYIYYNDKELELSVKINEDKKKVIGDLKKELEKDYPIIYKKNTSIPNADEVRKLLNSGKTLEEALNCTQTSFEPLFRVERIHDKYNEMDLLSLSDGNMYKFKCKIPLIAILEDLKYNGKESNALENINMLYKINSTNEKSA